MPGVPPVEGAGEERAADAPIGDVDPVMAEATAAADAEAQAAAAAEAARVEEEARVKAEAEETERTAQAIRQAQENADREATAALQAKINACKNILRNYVNTVRRTTREDAVEWLERMCAITKDIAGAAFDQLVSEPTFSKETVDRAKTITVTVDEFFLKSKT